MIIQKNWNLKRYFYTKLRDPKLDADIAALLPATKKFVKKYEGKIKKFKKAGEVLKFYEDVEKLDALSDKPGHFLFYLGSLDTQDTEVQKKMGELEVLGIQINQMMLFVNQEFKSLGEKKLREFAEKSKLAAYRNALASRADTIKYLLEEKQEFVLNIKSRPLSVLGNVHEELRSSFEFEMVVGGKKKTLTEEEVRAYARHPNRELRKKASEAMRKVYLTKQNQLVFGNVYGGIVKNWTSNMQLRGYKTVMSRRNISEEMEDKVVDTLMNKVQEYYPLFQRFLKAKRKHLGLKILNSYDVYAPVKKVQKKYTIEEAVEKHLEVMRSFDPIFYGYSQDMFAKGRVDVMPAKGKRGGAYASYTQGQESFVLLNFTGIIDDIFTLTHEMGHAIHGHLAQIQKPAVYDAPLCLAETASIFNEMLLSENLMGELTPAQKLELLNQQLMDIMGTIFRQVMYVSFEKRVHEKILAGEELTYKEFNLLWHEESEKLTGGIIKYAEPPENTFTWSAIPHIFHTPFYCYAYAFGMILSFSLMHQYRKRGADFIPDYRAILSSGGSKRPKELLKEYGINIAKSSFYDAAFSEIEKLVSEFEKS